MGALNKFEFEKQLPFFLELTDHTHFDQEADENIIEEENVETKSKNSK